jgi:hypothetical protein
MDHYEIGCEGKDWLIWPEIGSSGELFEHGNELSGFIKGGKFLES